MFDIKELSIFLLITAIHCFILGGLIVGIRQGNKANKALSLVFLLFGIYLIEFYGVVRDSWPTWMSLWTYPLLYGLGPLLYQLARGNLAIQGKKLDLRSTAWIVLSVYLIFLPFFLINFQADDLVECRVCVHKRANCPMGILKLF